MRVAICRCGHNQAAHTHYTKQGRPIYCSQCDCTVFTYIHSRWHPTWLDRLLRRKKR